MGSLLQFLLLALGSLVCLSSAASILPLEANSTTLNTLDQTLVPGARGRDVVLAVVHKIQLAQIFAGDNRFFVRLAWVESEFGEASNTAPGTGIWKVLSAYLDKTQSPGEFPNLVQLHARISASFAINWMTVTIADLNKPLYSGLAARLYLETVGVPIPVSINDQAQYWRQHYNHNEEWNVATFINAITLLEQVFACNGKLDLYMVLDGSGSMLNYFEAAKSFMATLVSRFSLQHIHVGLIVYDSKDALFPVFPLSNALTVAEMVAAIQAVPMPANEEPVTGERPDLGIRTGIQEMRNSVFREGAPQVIAVFYDGGGNADLLQAAVNEAKSFDINTYSIMVGNSELWGPNAGNFLITAGNDPSQILQTPPALDEVSMAQFAYKLNDQVCRTTQNRAVNQGDILSAGETRYYNYHSNNITLFAYMKQGSITVYYSFTIPNPSSAIYEGFFNASTGPPTGLSNNNNLVIHSLSPPPSSRVDGITYVAVRGVGQQNSYTLVGVAN